MNNCRPIEVGPRGALLLGMLARPMTAAELASLVDRADSLDDDVIALLDMVASRLSGVLGQSPRIVLRGIQDGGRHEVLLQLARLESAGLVRRLGEEDGGLWWRLPVSDWPA